MTAKHKKKIKFMDIKEKIDKIKKAILKLIKKSGYMKVFRRLARE